MECKKFAIFCAFLLNIGLAATFDVEVPPWDTFCLDNNIPDETFFPQPDNCNLFTVCENLNDGLRQYACGPGENFDHNLRECNSNAPCITGKEPQWPPRDHHENCPPPGSNDLVLLPSLYCDSFYICINGWPIEMQCRPGQHWNADLQFCDDPIRAGCENGGPPPLPDCPWGYVGNLPHPEDCNMFIHCNNGNRMVQRCQHLHHFDVIQGRCLIMTVARCIDEYRGGRPRN